MMTILSQPLHVKSVLEYMRFRSSRGFFQNKYIITADVLQLRDISMESTQITGNSTFCVTANWS